MHKKTIWELERDSVEEFRAKPKLPLWLILDNVRSLNNIGSMLRTSDAFMVRGVAMCGITATPPSAEIHKTALGAEDAVTWCHYDSAVECLGQLHDQGYQVCCLEQVDGSVALGEFPVDAGTRYALVVGNEVDGVSSEVVDRCDHWLEIPQSGTKHSLNVAVSAGIALWHFYQAMTRHG